MVFYGDGYLNIVDNFVVFGVRGCKGKCALVCSDGYLFAVSANAKHSGRVMSFSFALQVRAAIVGNVNSGTALSIVKFFSIFQKLRFLQLLRLLIR